eukprot:6446882-Amphidinium_carterae.1
MDTVAHIVAECPGVLGEHRAYLEKITCEESKQLLIRTGLPQATPEITDLGEKEYAKFAHQLAASLVKRNMLNAEREAQELPQKRRLRHKQPPPRAYGLDRTIAAKRVKPARKPNLQQRVDLMYHVDDDGTWKVNGHFVRPIPDTEGPKLRCDMCSRTSAWNYKHVYLTYVCDMRQRKVHANHLKDAPAHVEVMKGALRCKVCGMRGTTNHSGYFLKKHAQCA